MAKASVTYVCQSCGSVTAKWAGRCESCGAWNSIVAEAAPQSFSGRGPSLKGRALSLVPLQGKTEKRPRILSGLSEVDRVTGGGFVPASALLLGGDPGVGKSTLLLQVLAGIAKENPAARRVYISGEESLDQVRLRAERLGVAEAPIELAASTSVADLLATLSTLTAPSIVIIDSIQTLYHERVESAPGTVSQVRAAAQELIHLAKRVGFTLVFVGHVTKEGLFAGPKVLEHMVDAVLSFEGERGHQFRILRAVKNRFGPTDEIGVFEMQDQGLMEVTNPSALFLGNRQEAVAGTAVFAGMEGTRPLLVEIQALVAAAPYGSPRRAVVGWDSGRLAMVLAVLEARCGLSFANRDVYLSVAGGFKVSEPAADFAVALALASAASDKPLPQKAVVFGEIGLAGELRPVSQSEQRLKESAKLGFELAFLPAGTKAAEQQSSALSSKSYTHIRSALVDFAKPRQ